MTHNLPEENIYGHTKKLKFILEQIDDYKKTHQRIITILDFGCGNGSAVSQYLLNNDTYYYGVEIHKPSLDYARSHYQKNNAYFLDHIPENILFDVIVYSDVLEHLDNPVMLLREHYGILKDEGIIIGIVPNGFGPFEIEKRLDAWFGFSKGLDFISKLKRKIVGAGGKNADTIPYNADSGHVQYFKKNSLNTILQMAGFHMYLFKKGAFIGAPVSERTVFRCKTIIQANAKIADFLPYWAVSTWYFVATKDREMGCNDH